MAKVFIYPNFINNNLYTRLNSPSLMGNFFIDPRLICVFDPRLDQR